VTERTEQLLQEILAALKGQSGSASITSDQSLELQVQFAEKILDSAKKSLDLAKGSFETKQAELEVEKAKLSKEEAELKLRLKKSALGEEEKRRLIEISSLLDGINKDREKLNEQTEDQLSTLQGIKDATDKIAGMLGLQVGKQESLISKGKDILKIVKNRGNLSREVSEELGKQLEYFKQTFSFSNMLFSTLKKIQEVSAVIVLNLKSLVKVFDSTSASFNKATGAAGRFDREMVNLVSNTMDSGGNIESVSAAYSSLLMNMSSFTTLSESQRGSVAATGVQLELAGVSAETYANNMDFLTRALKMNADEAASHQANLAEFASGIGVTTSKMAQDFQQAQPIMARYGKAVGDRVFKNLATTAKAAGVEIGALLGITQGFDTFEDAAMKAGQLNALLGGPYLNSVELLTASEDEKIKMIRRSILASGRSFNQLARFEKQSIMTAAGISDMTLASKLFGASEADFRKVTQEQKSLAEQAKASQDIQMKLNQIMGLFLPLASEIVDVVRDAADSFINFAQRNKSLIKGIALTTVVMGGLFTLMSALASILAGVGFAALMSAAGVSILGIALQALGIGLIIAALAALVYWIGKVTGAWDDMTSVVSNPMSIPVPTPSIPSRQTGGVVTRTGAARVHAGETIVPAGTRPLAQGGNNTTVVLELNGRELGKAVVDLLAGQNQPLSIK